MNASKLSTLKFSISDDLQLLLLPPDDGPGRHVPDQPVDQVPDVGILFSGTDQKNKLVGLFFDCLD
jgi:hypothetical protein